MYYLVEKATGFWEKEEEEVGEKRKEKKWFRDIGEKKE